MIDGIAITIGLVPRGVEGISVAWLTLPNTRGSIEVGLAICSDYWKTGWRNC